MVRSITFFSQMGRTRFVVFFDGDRVIGSVAGVWKRFWLGRQQHMGLYAADLKLDPKYRGAGTLQSCALAVDFALDLRPNSGLGLRLFSCNAGRERECLAQL